jgi:hypothetical protein
MSVVLDVNGLSIRMAHSLRKTPTCEGLGGRLPSCRDSCSTRYLQPETELQDSTRPRLAEPRRALSAPIASVTELALVLPQHPDEHCS